MIKLKCLNIVYQITNPKDEFSTTPKLEYYFQARKHYPEMIQTKSPDVSKQLSEIFFAVKIF